jgi:glyoxylase-like metal-dependent hydrolase (beta-lactamase superfamily II)
MRIDAIDLGYLGLAGAASAFLVRDAGATALVECGPAACLATLEAALGRLGAARIDELVLTHIHLDHAGAAGHLARRFPAMRIRVHPLGLRHLADPKRLVASSRLVHGERYEREYGDPHPVEGPIDAVEDRACVPFGRGRFRAIATPGHAKHHHAWMLEDASGGRTLFTGDAAGMRVPGSDWISIPMPPPDLDRDAWRDSLGRLAAEASGGPFRVALTHGGIVEDGSAHLALVRARLEEELALFTPLAEGVEGGELSVEAALAAARERLAPAARAAGVDDGRLSSFLGRAYRAMNLAGVRHELARRSRSPGAVP